MKITENLLKTQKIVEHLRAIAKIDPAMCIDSTISFEYSEAELKHLETLFPCGAIINQTYSAYRGILVSENISLVCRYNENFKLEKIFQS